MDFDIDFRALKATGRMTEAEVVIGFFVLGLGITLGTILL